MNFENIYKARKFEQAIYEAERKVEKAKQDVIDAKHQFIKQCSKISNIPVEQLKISNYSCCADGIVVHIHYNKYPSIYGHHENKCIFCGIDDVDTI